MFTWLLDDVGIPANYRHMDGFGVHTFTLTKGDKTTFVKFHWHTDQGVKNLSDEDAVTTGVHASCASALPCVVSLFLFVSWHRSEWLCSGEHAAHASGMTIDGVSRHVWPGFHANGLHQMMSNSLAVQAAPMPALQQRTFSRAFRMVSTQAGRSRCRRCPRKTSRPSLCAALPSATSC